LATLPPDARTALTAELQAAGRDSAQAWLEICVCARGDISAVYRRGASSPRAYAAFAAAISGWKFKPITVGGSAVPACAQLRFVYPADATVAAEVLPPPYPPDDTVHTPLAALTRLRGSDSIPPDETTRNELELAGG